MRICACGCGLTPASHNSVAYVKGHRPVPTPAERFWAKVSKSEECWVWNGRVDQDGYGRFKFEGRSVRAPRVSYILNIGPIPPGLFVLHSCDNPGCVRPDHLRVGDNVDNMRDMVKRGRSVRRRCADNPRSKLTWEAVVGIHDARRAGLLQREIGEQFGICQSLVSAVLRGNKWPLEQLTEAPPNRAKKGGDEATTSVEDDRSGAGAVTAPTIPRAALDSLRAYAARKGLDDDALTKMAGKALEQLTEAESQALTTAVTAHKAGAS